MELEGYSTQKIDGHLLNYKVFVRDLAEMANDWPTMQGEERSHYKVDFMHVWGLRKTLGQLYQAQQLTHTQEEQLAQLDQLLLEQSGLMEQCFGFELAQILVIFRWGTPLAQSAQPVHIQTDTVSLQHLAQALAPVV